MPAAPLPPDEITRLAAPRALDIIDSPPADVFDADLVTCVPNGVVDVARTVALASRRVRETLQDDAMSSALTFS